MNGIDISRYQPNIDLSKVPCDFVIIKATEGNSFVSNCFTKQIEQALSLGKKVGIYHYANGCGVDAEANHFVEVIKPYLGKAILALDWEGDNNSKFGDCNYAISLLRKIKELTGITPFIYMSKSYARQWKTSWKAIAATNPLWCAQYANSNHTDYQENPWTDSKGFGPWGDSCAILQYSSHGRLEGYNANLDIDKAYITAEQWDMYAGKVNEAPAQSAPVKKSNEEIAKEVLAGVWGNGVDRKNNIEKAGYDYSEIQKIVNNLCNKPSAKKVTKKVLAKKGLWMHNRANTSGSTRTIVLPYGTVCTVLETTKSMTKVSCTYRNKVYTGWLSTNYLG